MSPHQEKAGRKFMKVKVPRDNDIMLINPKVDASEK
jgi:hypothetical protein